MSLTNTLHFALQNLIKVLRSVLLSQELKGYFLIKGKRLNKLDAAFNNNSVEEDESVSEEDEAAEENIQKPKEKVCWL